jgi:hypothetical protein
MITFPDGLVGRAFGPLAGANNDRNAVEEGQCRQLVRDHFHGFSLYGDSIYYDYEPEVSVVLTVPFDISLLQIIAPFQDASDESRQMNYHMSRVRVSIENVIGAIYQICPILYRKFKLGSEPAGPIFITACFLYNVHVCATRSPGSSARFGVPAPLLDEYLHPLPPVPEDTEEIGELLVDENDF